MSISKIPFFKIFSSPKGETTKLPVTHSKISSHEYNELTAPKSLLDEVSRINARLAKEEQSWFGRLGLDLEDFIREQMYRLGIPYSFAKRKLEENPEIINARKAVDDITDYLSNCDDEKKEIWETFLDFLGGFNQNGGFASAFAKFRRFLRNNPQRHDGLPKELVELLLALPSTNVLKKASDLTITDLFIKLNEKIGILTPEEAVNGLKNYFNDYSQEKQNEWKNFLNILETEFPKLYGYDNKFPAFQKALQKALRENSQEDLKKYKDLSKPFIRYLLRLPLPQALRKEGLTITGLFTELGGKVGILTAEKAVIGLKNYFDDCSQKKQKEWKKILNILETKFSELPGYDNKFPAFQKDLRENPEKYEGLSKELTKLLSALPSPATLTRKNNMTISSLFIELNKKAGILTAEEAVEGLKNYFSDCSQEKRDEWEDFQAALKRHSQNRGYEKTFPTFQRFLRKHPGAYQYILSEELIKYLLALPSPSKLNKMIKISISEFMKEIESKLFSEQQEPKNSEYS